MYRKIIAGNFSNVFIRKGGSTLKRPDSIICLAVQNYWETYWFWPLEKTSPDHYNLRTYTNVWALCCGQPPRTPLLAIFLHARPPFRPSPLSKILAQETLNQTSLNLYYSLRDSITSLGQSRIVTKTLMSQKPKCNGDYLPGVSRSIVESISTEWQN